MFIQINLSCSTISRDDEIIQHRFGLIRFTVNPAVYLYNLGQSKMDTPNIT